MATVTVKCFGVLRIDSKLDPVEMQAANIAEVFEKINSLIETDMKVGYTEALTYINGDFCTSKHQKLHDGDEVWMISAASVAEKEKPKVKKPKAKKPVKKEPEKKEA